jgi:hypothetical protein
MKNTCRYIFIAIFAILYRTDYLLAQAPVNPSGNLSGSVESNSIWYAPDRTASTPDDRFGSNNYLKLDYSRGNFTAGMQYEFYAPALVGFNPNLRGSKLTSKFVGWSDGRFNVTVGDFYEQFGSGLVLRSWEDRALGFNNSLEGVRAGFTGDFVSVKAIWARPRLFMDYADSWVRGGDVSVDVSSLLKMERHYLALEGSYINRFMGGNTAIAGKQGVDMWSGRLNFSSGGFSLKGEWVGKGDDLYLKNGEWQAVKGNAQLIEASYTHRGFTIFVTGRRLDHIGTKIDAADGSEANTLNYLPSLTRQYTYSLATLEPYNTDTNGEQGGRIDIFYNVARGSAIGGKYGLKIHANASTLYPLEKKGRKMNPLYRDISFDVEKRWNKDLKTTFLYAVQTFSPSKAITATTTVNNVFVADVLYKFTSQNSLRVELQYLYSKENSDWWAATAEVGLAPRWSFFVGDMYNHGGEKIHYYQAGMSYARSRTRIAVSYARNRAGYVCSGGVCRYMPAYTGANVSLTTSF